VDPEMPTGPGAPEEETRAGSVNRPLTRPLPSHVGPFRVIELLGQGGMGAVYLAEQTQPFRRPVAVKVIKPGMDSDQVIARFETERQALALMNHPNVARVLDAGATSDGRPYFVMEHVPGVPITDYCDRHTLNARERLKLFLSVCDAVQHAHQKGIIHRDLKPSNVLVALQDDVPVPKVIDFGVAKAIEQRLTEKTLYTELGQLVGTPEYMSPEQAEMTVLDIDTRTDIYSLGVLLYELLVGALPFDRKALRRTPARELPRLLRHEDPVTPSTRLSTLGAEAVDVAKKRRTDSAGLRRLLRGDFDWITMKALEKGSDAPLQHGLAAGGRHRALPLVAASPGRTAVGQLPDSEVRGEEPRPGHRRRGGPPRARRRPCRKQRPLLPRRTRTAARRYADARGQARQRVPHPALRGLGSDRGARPRGHRAQAARQGRCHHRRDERSARGPGYIDGYDGPCVLHARPLRSGR
jgi:predicted Ser/Thr protein kinase